jgi:hypothetical protein
MLVYVGLFVSAYLLPLNTIFLAGWRLRSSKIAFSQRIDIVLTSMMLWWAPRLKHNHDTAIVLDRSERGVYFAAAVESSKRRWALVSLCPSPHKRASGEVVSWHTKILSTIHPRLALCVVEEGGIVRVLFSALQLESASVRRRQFVCSPVCRIDF